MPLTTRVVLLLLACVLYLSGRLHAQLPFYTDDTGVTEPGKWHFEFFNEYDALQLQYPNLRQNTAISNSTMACRTTWSWMWTLLISPSIGPPGTNLPAERATLTWE